MNANGETAAEQLAGLTLAGGWKVTARMQQNPSATGGNFSVGYLAEGANGQRAFLKAIDFERVMRTWKGVDILRALQAMTESYNFERDVLKTCRDLRLSRIATAVDDGCFEVAGFEPLHQVYYLVFDLADRDARAHLDSAPSLEAIWCLRTLQHVATGIRQLHSNGIAHQDLKASNVLEYGANGSRVGDFGRASRLGSTAPHDVYAVAGDKGYAPPELLYSFVPQDWNMRRFGCDAYLLGSLTYFFFSRASMTAAVMSLLHPGHSHLNWSGSFADVLPFLRDGFDEVLRDFSDQTANSLGPRIGRDIVQIVRELCEPDPALRGSPLQRGSSATQFGVERYIARFNMLADRAAVQGLR